MRGTGSSACGPRRGFPRRRRWLWRAAATRASAPSATAFALGAWRGCGRTGSSRFAPCAARRCLGVRRSCVTKLAGSIFLWFLARSEAMRRLTFADGDAAGDGGRGGENLEDLPSRDMLCPSGISVSCTRMARGCLRTSGRAVRWHTNAVEQEPAEAQFYTGMDRACLRISRRWCDGSQKQQSKEIPPRSQTRKKKTDIRSRR